MKKFIKGRWVPLIVAISILVLVAGVVLMMVLLGWRFTYAPELENSWDAISAFAAWVGVLVSVIGVVASFIAIWYAIQVPKKIADRQDKIALFERRYECFQFFEECIILCNRSEEEGKTKKIMEICYHILEIQETDHFRKEDFYRKSEQFEYILHQMEFLFPGIKEDDVEELYNALSMYLFALIFKKEVESEKQCYIVAIKKFGKYINDIWECMTISNIS